MRNKIIKDELPEIKKHIERYLKFKEGTPMLDFLAQYNDYYPMTNKWHSS